MLDVYDDNHSASIIDGMALLQAFDESKFDTFNYLELVVTAVWSEPSVRRISASVSVGVCMCSVVAMQADP